MAAQADFSLPEAQTALVQIALAPPTSISGWTIKHDIMWRYNSPQPIISFYLASGYTSGQSGCTLVNGSLGIFGVQYNQIPISGDSQYTNVLLHQSYRIDSGYSTPIAVGFRLLSPY